MAYQSYVPDLQQKNDRPLQRMVKRGGLALALILGVATVYAVVDFEEAEIVHSGDEIRADSLHDASFRYRVACPLRASNVHFALLGGNALAPSNGG